MARTSIAPISLPGGFPALPLTALSARIAFAAANAVDGNRVPLTGRELILVKNTDAGAQTVTIKSSLDGFNRAGDITAYSIPAGEVAGLGPFPMGGWAQPSDGGALWIDVSSANIQLAVVRLPSLV